jgi:CheY-like chemotaxis protein
MGPEKKIKILVVDDNNDILDLFEIMLCKDFEVITAPNGFEGLKKATVERPQLIITDIMMPMMDGIRFFNQLKMHEPLKPVPVVAVTTFVRRYTQKSLLSMGFAAVIPKPFTKDEVMSIVARFTKIDRTEG